MSRAQGFENSVGNTVKTPCLNIKAEQTSSEQIHPSKPGASPTVCSGGNWMGQVPVPRVPYLLGGTHVHEVILLQDRLAVW